MPCCQPKLSKVGHQSCPECGDSCLSVKMNTMIHHIQYPENTKVPDGEYAFCPSRVCKVGYFSGSYMINAQKLRSLQRGQEEMLCYCFDISEALYKSAIVENTAEKIKAFVVHQTKIGACACEVRNPSGRCCLSNFR
jgi:hypothetical protein